MFNPASLLSEATGGVERRAKNVCSSLVQAIVVAPLLLLVTCGVLGWNEQHAVCRDKVIQEGRQKVLLLGCEETQEAIGELVMLNCDIQKPEKKLYGVGAFSNFSVVGTGLKVTAQMLQCIEKKEEEKDKNGKVTKTTYSYSVEWKEHAVDSGSFRRENAEFKSECGVTNPPWPREVPHSTVRYAKNVKVGGFGISKFVSSIPLHTPVQGWDSPDGWTQLSEGEFETTSYVRTGALSQQPSIGTIRISFAINDWSRPEATALGQNSNGDITEWFGSSDWLCQGFDLGELRMGSKSKEVLFNELAEEETMRAWCFRIGGFIALWIGFCCCLSPLSAIAESVPFVGNFFGEMMNSLACILSCLPASMLWLVVVGMCWLAMRPLYGCTALALAVGLLVLMCHGLQQMKKAREVQGAPFQQLEDGLDRPLTQPTSMQMRQHPHALWQQPSPQLPVMQSMQTAQPVQPMHPVQQMQTQQSQPAYAQAPTFQAQSPEVRQMMVVVPAGSGPGSLVSVTTPDGEAKQVQVPAGVMAGQNFVMQY